MNGGRHVVVRVEPEVNLQAHAVSSHIVLGPDPKTVPRECLGGTWIAVVLPCPPWVVCCLRRSKNRRARASSSYSALCSSRWGFQLSPYPFAITCRNAWSARRLLLSGSWMPSSCIWRSVYVQGLQRPRPVCAGLP